MTMLEQLENALRYGAFNKSLILDAKSEIERLEKQNTLLKSALTGIHDIPKTQYDYVERVERIIENTLNQ